jgi:hypothetical protein
VEYPGEAVQLNLLWRRRDRDPAYRRFIIIHSATNDTIPNIKRISVNNEKCELIFGPANEKGKYYFYYLPYKPDTTYGSYEYGYWWNEQGGDLDTIKDNEQIRQ